MSITVNGTLVEVLSPDISYEEIVELAKKKGYPTVVYSGKRTGDTQRAGEMHVGCKRVRLEDGMYFSVIHTDNA